MCSEDVRSLQSSSFRSIDEVEQHVFLLACSLIRFGVPGHLIGDLISYVFFMVFVFWSSLNHMPIKYMYLIQISNRITPTYLGLRTFSSLSCVIVYSDRLMKSSNMCSCCLFLDSKQVPRTSSVTWLVMCFYGVCSLIFNKPHTYQIQEKFQVPIGDAVVSVSFSIFSNFYWLDLQNKTWVALAHLRWSIDKIRPPLIQL